MGSSHSKNHGAKEERKSSSMYSTERRNFPAKILPPRFNSNATTAVKRPKTEEKSKNIFIRKTSSGLRTPLSMKKSISDNENSLLQQPTSYPYPRGHTTVLVPSSSWNCRPAISSPIVEEKPFLMDKSTKFERSKVVNFSDSSTRKTMGGFVKKFAKPAAGVCVPSPIYSCSEPSSLSVSRSETREFANNAADPSLQDQQSVETAVVECKNLEQNANYVEQQAKSSMLTKKLSNPPGCNDNQLKRPTNFKMPIPNLAKSVTVSNAKNTSDRNDSSSSSGAPLAESESFVIENSPMVEIAPKMAPERTKNVKFVPNSESKIPLSIRAPIFNRNFTSKINTLAESRLKNSTKYSKMQNLIYGKFEKATKVGILQDTNLHISLDENRNVSSKIGNLCIDSKDLVNNNNNTTPETVKSGHSTSGSDAGNSSSCKVPSPNGSFVRGIIDDEIHDQPDLSVGYQVVTSGNDQASNTCTPISIEDVVMTSCLSPSPMNCDYHHEPSPFRPLVAAGRQRSISGCQPSMATSDSIHSCGPDDLMLDFDDESRPRSSNLPFADEILLRKVTEEIRDEHNSSQSKKKLHETSEPSCSFNSNKQVVLQNGYSSPESPNFKSSKILSPNINVSSNDQNGAQNLMTLDPKSFLHLSQDVTVLKTLLFRLKRVLQEGESLNSPELDQLHPKLHTVAKDATFDEYSTDDLKEENSALRTQVALLYVQLNEKDQLLNQSRRKIEELEKALASSKPNGLCKNGEISSRKEFLIDQR